MGTLSFLVRGYEKTTRQPNADTLEFESTLRQLVDLRQMMLDADKFLDADRVENEEALQDIHDAVMQWHGAAPAFVSRINAFAKTGEHLPSAASYFHACREGPITSLLRRKQQRAIRNDAEGRTITGNGLRDVLQASG